MGKGKRKFGRRLRSLQIEEGILLARSVPLSASERGGVPLGHRPRGRGKKILLGQKEVVILLESFCGLMEGRKGGKRGNLSWSQRKKERIKTSGVRLIFFLRRSSNTPSSSSLIASNPIPCSRGEGFYNPDEPGKMRNNISPKLKKENASIAGKRCSTLGADKSHRGENQRDLPGRIEKNCALEIAIKKEEKESGRRDRRGKRSRGFGST